MGNSVEVNIKKQYVANDVKFFLEEILSMNCMQCQSVWASSAATENNWHQL